MQGWFLETWWKDDEDVTRTFKLFRDNNSSRYKALVENVLNIEKNNKDKTGCYIFNFFKMGEWKNVIVDDQLPLKLYENTRVVGKKGERKKWRGDTFDPEDVEEYWALLLTKVIIHLS